MPVSKNVSELVIKLRDELSGKSENARSRIASLGKTIQAASKAALAFGVTAAAMGASILAVAKKAADYGDEMIKASQGTGVGLENLSGLRLAADLAGVSFEELQQGLIRFSTNIVDTARGTGEAREAFQALGITVKNQDGTLKNSDQLLAEIADKFSKMPDSTQKTAIAVDLFGRAGARLIPLLNAGSEGIAKFTDEARNMGLVMNERTAKAMEKFNDDLRILQLRAEGAAIAIGIELVKAINEMARVAPKIFGILSGGATDFQMALKKVDQNILAIEERLRKLATQKGSFAAIERELLQGRLGELGAERADLEKLIAGITGSPPKRTVLPSPATDSDKAAKELVERTKRAVGDTRDALGEEADFFGSDAFREAIAKVEADSIVAGERINEIFSRISREGMGEAEQKIFDITEHFKGLIAEVQSSGEAMGLTSAGVQHLVGQLRQVEQTQVGKVLQDESQKAAQAMQDNFQQAGDSITRIIETFSRAGKVNIGTIVVEVIKLVQLLQKANAIGLPGGASAGSSGFNILGAIGSLAGIFGGFFQTGGTVPGPIGKPKVAVVHGGEEITPAGKRTGNVVNIYNDMRGAGSVTTEMRREIRAAMKQARLEAVAEVRERTVRGGSYSRDMRGS